MRRLCIVTLILAAAGLVMASGAGWAQKGPIKVGLILPETGPLAANGKDMANGMQLFFEEQGFKLAGREGSYVGGLALKAALEATGGDIESVEKFLGAVRRVDLSEAPRGPIRFDDYGNPVENIYVRKVERVGGKLQNTVIHTFPSVSQFWTFKPEEFLKNPVYSRDYPPCKHC
jgi:ABC-type branched-subunit amino acid transport system substrate-binding protein